MALQNCVREKQLQFSKSVIAKTPLTFGGSLLRGSHAKTKRPLSTRFPIHMVLRANAGILRKPQNFVRVNRRVTSACKKYGITVYEFANVGNHLHLLIRLHSQTTWSAFVRELTGSIARMLAGQIGKCTFWAHRPFTRIVKSWGRAFRDVKDYVHLNFLEAEGFVNRRETQNLAEYRQILWGG